MSPSALLFSTFEVTSQAFYRNALSYAIVNLKPIVPGHVLVIPTRPVPRLADLNDTELGSLMRSVSRVGNVIERVYGADALTIACQDGKAAGQSVPHVHFHILPRKLQGDRFSENNDAIYPELEKAEAGLSSDMRQTTQDYQPLKVDADDARPPRTMEEMVKEANWLKGFFDKDEIGCDVD
ncbi:diadenosine 5',5'''-P1,P4-tetraphosphate asymmetrical hydrolase [Coprinopsis cinerea okayama7|uniref:Diadenosine 5',5'''-P1,P4-tetraphosphate asymmetrical hydrolase n=1 Tax=Coprinopsis cinerea (strain Okayama-7 / 130 / ATCC MYA-4618 / FGSC 9003) TaxID=240176 RepID=A8NEY2_COPC7|nr:diadenosine 5',5'''-P1,P4-tetraphosphate asymmetrical hydrolase [Coprinopsis cinerea okayama7\|eukprot:XP_001833161.2 diadenosine 5',5'''-P1,P4-tetraphosphate asymmetrical hydrolase [Coprinopsis cinerea okayama7\